LSAVAITAAVIFISAALASGAALCPLAKCLAQLPRQEIARGNIWTQKQISTGPS